MDENALARLAEQEKNLYAELNEVDEKIRDLRKQLEVPLPKSEEGFEHVIVLDNVPVIPESKLEKLTVCFLFSFCVPSPSTLFSIPRFCG